LAVLLAAGAASIALYAQTVLGPFTGTVKDASDASVQAAT